MSFRWSALLNHTLAGFAGPEGGAGAAAGKFGDEQLDDIGSPPGPLSL